MSILLVLCVIAGVFVGWIFIEVLVVLGGGKIRMPWLLNAMSSFIGGVGTYMFCIKVLGMH